MKHFLHFTLIFIIVAAFPLYNTLMNESMQKLEGSLVSLLNMRIIPKCHVPGILIDTTAFAKLNQRDRMNRIIDMSKERVEASRSD